MTRAAPDFAKPCYRRIREVRGGVWVGARIFRNCHCTIGGGDDSLLHPWTDACDRYPHLQAERNGMSVPVEWVWTSGEEIEEWMYRFLIAHREHAVKHRPDSAEANPRKPVDWNTVDPPKF